MAFYREDIASIDLQNGTVHRSFMSKTIGEGDTNENRFGFRCFRNGNPVSLNGSAIIGHFMRADGVTVEIDGGAVTGDIAYITLPASCYAVEGNFTLVIKLVGGGVTGTIRIVDGTVINTTNGTVIDPGNVIPDLSDYLAAVDDVIAAAETIEGISITAQLISAEDYEFIITKS